MSVLSQRRTDCAHVPDQEAVPRAEACEDCSSSFSLRVCAGCGYVGCCESQLGHNPAHAVAHGHPVIRSLPLSSHSFAWCYECHRYV